MKRILALILAVFCVLSLASCRKNKDETPAVNAEEVAPFQAKIDASVPETATVTVTFKSTLGTLNSEYLVTYNMDGSATVAYTYEEFNTPDSSEFKSTYEGQTNISTNGTLSSAPEGIASVEALTFDINLDPTKIYSATVTSGIISIVVKAENTEAVLGVNLGVDATVVISVGTLGVGSVAISYTTAEGTVDIVSTYTYYVEPEEEETEE